MIDCGITKCYLYDKDCFFKTVLVRKPDPKTGCSYCRRIKKGKIELTVELDENGNKIRKTRSDKGQPREKKGKKRKKEENSLQEIL